MRHPGEPALAAARRDGDARVMALTASAPATAPPPLSPEAALGPPRTAGERDAMLAALQEPATWPRAAAGLLAELGFRLMDPERSNPETWHLLIALRDRPALSHFDPEIVSFYAPTGSSGSIVSLDRYSNPGARSTRTALWGHLLVVDRVPVENRFLHFGGDLRVAQLGPALTVLDLASPGPIVRWGGHSQGTDELAPAMGAFFARLLVRIDFVAGTEALIDAQPPGVLYRAFLADSLSRVTAGERRGLERSGLSAWIAAAWLRARHDPEACHAAHRLLRALDLDRPST